MRGRAPLSDFDVLLQEEAFTSPVIGSEDDRSLLLNGDELLELANQSVALGLEDGVLPEVGAQQENGSPASSFGDELLKLAIAAQQHHAEDAPEKSWAEIRDEHGIPEGEEESVLERYAASVVAQGQPILRREGRRTLELRDWDLEFSPMSAPAGQVVTFNASPQCFFKGEKVVATDSATPPGTGTRIMQIAIGNRVQRPGSRSRNTAVGGSLTAFFAQTALANGLLWDTCQPSMTISVDVSFVQACTFDMTVFGKAVY